LDCIVQIGGRQVAEAGKKRVCGLPANAAGRPSGLAPHCGTVTSESGFCAMV
jgi:hypothetical protein